MCDQRGSIKPSCIYYIKHLKYFFSLRLAESKSNARVTSYRFKVGRQFLASSPFQKKTQDDFLLSRYIALFLIGVLKARDEKAAADVTNPIFTPKSYSLSSAIRDLGKPFQD